MDRWEEEEEEKEEEEEEEGGPGPGEERRGGTGRRETEFGQVVTFSTPPPARMSTFFHAGYFFCPQQVDNVDKQVSLSSTIKGKKKDAGKIWGMLG